jgi:ribosome-associated protein
MKSLSTLAKLRLAFDAAQSKVAEDPLALDVRDVVSFADTFLILTGRSDRHVQAIAGAVVAALAARGAQPLGVEGETEGRWALLDFGDLIVHVFQREVREAYALERLWSDASEIRLAGGRAASVEAPEQGREAAAQRAAGERSAGPRESGREAAAQRAAGERRAGPRSGPAAR